MNTPAMAAAPIDDAASKGDAAPNEDQNPDEPTSTTKKSFKINPPKVNGFSRPFNRLQIASWFVYAYLNISFHAVFGCVDILGGVHILLSFGMMASAFYATKANVVDTFIRERGFPTPKMTMDEFREKHRESLVKKQLFWCKHCEWYVSKKAKHCRACNRCTDEFDHHCRWLNNCVSKQNYHLFVGAIVCTEGLLLYEIVLGALMLTDLAPTHARTPLVIDGGMAWHSLLALHLLIASMMALPLLQLIGFHLYLHQKAISTYEWVVRRDTDKLERMEQRENEALRRKAEARGRARAKQRANERTANFNSNQRNQQKAKGTKVHNRRKSIKSEMVETMRSTVWALCSKTMEATRSNGDGRVKYDASREIAVDTNVDVKLSGLTSNGSTDDLTPANANGGDVLALRGAQRHPEPTRRSCVCCCFAKRRNAVGSLVWVKGRVQHYSNENGHVGSGGDVDDVIFGPDNVGREKCQIVEVVEEEPMEVGKIEEERRSPRLLEVDEEEEEVRSPRLLSAKFESDEEKV